MDINVLFQIAILILSVIIHEVSHGYAALAWGDRTAEYEGRLTLNPLPHIDFWGSIVVPLLCYLSGLGFMIGWAKPVPYNPYNLRNRKVAEPMVALAGPLANFGIALVFGLIIRLMAASGAQSGPFIDILAFTVLLNIALAIFNLIPLPPLDGSKIFFSLLPAKLRPYVFSSAAARYGILIIILVLFFLPDFISPILFHIFSFITGIPL